MILKAAGKAVVLNEPATENEEKDDSLSHLLPPRNELAQHKNMVYKVEDLLTNLELGCLNDSAEKFFATQCNSKEAAMKLHADKQISKFGLKLRPGDRNKGPPSLQKF